MAEYENLEEVTPPRYSDVCEETPYHSTQNQQYHPVVQQYISTANNPNVLPVAVQPQPVLRVQDPAIQNHAVVNHLAMANNLNVLPVAGQPQPMLRFQDPVVQNHEVVDHLAMAIMVTICCCLPFGIVGIIKSSECRKARRQGDQRKAFRYGWEAYKFSMIGLGFGIVPIAIIAVVLLYVSWLTY